MRLFADRSSSTSSTSSTDLDAARRFTALPPRRSDRRSSAASRPPLTSGPRSILRQHHAEAWQAKNTSQDPTPLQQSYFPYTSPNPNYGSPRKRGSLPASLQPGARLPPPSTHTTKPRSSSLGVADDDGARARFSSVPTIDQGRGDARRRRQRKFSDTPVSPKSLPADYKSRQRYHIEGKDIPSRDNSPSSAIQSSGILDGLPPLVPKVHYRTLLLRLKRALRAQGCNIRDYMDAEDLHTLYVQDVEDREKRERDRVKIARVRKGLDKDVALRRVTDEGEPMHVFSAPLRESLGYASTTAILGGYRHDLPIVLFACVEELYRTGIYKPNLFREIPNRSRHIKLLEAFNTAPLFGSQVSLDTDSTSTICALLSTYLKNMSEPILDFVLFTPFWHWCVKPSVQRDERRAQMEEDEEDELRAAAYAEGRAPPKPSKRAILERQNAYTVEDDELEGPQIVAAKLILKLLPTHHFSVLVYLCAFFTQVPLCPENGMTEEDLGKMFGYEVFGGSRVASRLMMAWVLKRWTKISDGLMNADDVENAHRHREALEDVDKARQTREEEDAEQDVKKQALERRQQFLGIAPKSPAVPFDLIKYALGELEEPDKISLDDEAERVLTSPAFYGPGPSGSASDKRGSTSAASESSSSVNTKYQSEGSSEDALSFLENPYSRSGDFTDKGKGKEKEHAMDGDVVIAPDDGFHPGLLPSHIYAVDGDRSSVITKDSASHYSVPDVVVHESSTGISVDGYSTAPDQSAHSIDISNVDHSATPNTFTGPPPSGSLPMQSLPSTGTQLHHARERISELEKLLSAQEQSVAAQLHQVSVIIREDGDNESEEPLLDLMQEYEGIEAARAEEENKWLGRMGVDEDTDTVKKLLEAALEEKEKARKEKEEAQRLLEGIRSMLVLGDVGTRTGM